MHEIMKYFLFTVLFCTIYSRDPYCTILWWLDLYLGVVKGHWKNSLKIGHVTNTYIGGMYAFTMNSHDPKGLMRL